MNITTTKKFFAISTTLLIGTTSLTGCGNEIDETTIRVGVCAGPYGDMFKEAIEPALEKEGYQIEITEFSDYVQPNNALAENEIDVNMFQHSVYLKKFSEEHSLELSYITEIPTSAMGVFSNNY